MMAGATASTGSVSAAVSTAVSAAVWSKYGLGAVTPVATLALVPAVISSSATPSVLVTEPRTAVAIVSPVSNDAEMIAVPSMRPATINALRLRRRGMLRTPIFRKTKFFSAIAVSTPSAATRMTARAAASGPAGMPNTRSIGGSYPLAPTVIGGIATRTS
jgi:hypothetical protein